MLKGKGINAVILLGILSLASILVVQMVWMRKTIAIQQTNIAIQEKEDSLNLKEFSESAHIALRNVLEEITTLKADSSDLYGAVKQIRTNYLFLNINLYKLVKALVFIGERVQIFFVQTIYIFDMTNPVID